MEEIQHVFIVGSKGIPAAYGGFETFVDRLSFYKKDKRIQYHVSCAVEPEILKRKEREFTYNNARCFYVKWRKLGLSRAIFYDVDAIKECILYIKKHQIQKPIIYILACRIGPYMRHFKQEIHKLGGKVFVNPDGHEWKREKWSVPVRKYWKISERSMVKHADLLICDSQEIVRYICKDYKKYHPKATFIAYGAETTKSMLEDNAPEFKHWCEEKGVSPREYYLVVGRFVPENNFETMVLEYMKSDSKKDFVLVTGIEGNTFYNTLKNATHFDFDKRIKFVGTIYDKELLKKIRENAFGYFHGHEVGGTNPSLLESLGSTDLNLLLRVGFNIEVGGNSAIYWTKEPGNLAELINKADTMEAVEIEELGNRAKQRMKELYSWDYIVSRYEQEFLRRS